MLVRGTGRIISVSSVIGETGNIGQANYAASKSGLFGLTKSLAREAVFMLNRSSTPTSTSGLARAPTTWPGSAPPSRPAAR
jgi:acetoacetyl-CoA reductase/3-oxoacyl-[acyl-carrier protein] reductase